MAKRYSARKKTNWSAVVALTGLVLAICLMIGLGAWVYMRPRAEPIDKVTLCPLSGPKSVTVFLVDATDAISKTTLDDLKNEFGKAVDDVGPGGYLKIVRLSGEPRELPVMFDSCNPGDGSTVDEWTNNPRRQQKKWEEAFANPLDTLPEDFGEQTGANQSPIMAAIQTIKLTIFDSAFAGDAPRRLIVASDMLEHTSLYSQYGKPSVDYESYRESEAFRELGTELDDVSVDILYFDRQARKLDWRDHAEFWDQWIERQGGSLERFKRLEGLN
jgi:hypothetical protein